VVKNSRATKYFVRDGPATWRTFDCFFVYFRTVEIDIQHKRKILARLFREVTVSLWLRCWCRKDKVFCERLFTLHCQQSDKDKQIVDLAPGKISADAHGIEC